MVNSSSSVHKTFAFLEHFTPAKSEWGVSELARELGISKSKVFRFFSQMQDIGILDQNPDTEKYRLGLKLFELGNRVQLRSAFIEKTHAPLISVSDNIKETVHIAILKNHQVFYVDKVESPYGLKISSQIGSFNPAHATALGKVLLAYLPSENLTKSIKYIFGKKGATAYTSNTITQKSKLLKELKNINLKGYAIDREEFEVGLICVAIPIFNQSGEVVASLSASGPANRFNKEELNNYVRSSNNRDRNYIYLGIDLLKQIKTKIFEI